jgi:two-component system chemotaxis response regulator CheY
MGRILIVDDAAFMRMVLRQIVIEGGHQVVGEAGNGEEAISTYGKVLPDIVTMDITMPGMDGVEAVRQIISKHPTAKIIMCSAMGQKTMVIDAIKAGAKDFVVKPIQKEKLLEVLIKHL